MRIPMTAKQMVQSGSILLLSYGSLLSNPYFALASNMDPAPVRQGVYKEVPPFRSKAEITDLTAVISCLKQTDHWEKITDSDDIKGYEREVPGNPLFELKGFGKVDAPFDLIATIIIDLEHATDWIQDLGESKSVGGFFPVDYIELDLVLTPFVIRDREFLTRVRMKVDPVHRIVAYFMTSSDYPYPETPPRVRGVITNAVIASLPVTPSDPSKSLVYAAFQGDPKGSVPKWLVNLFQASWPKDTLKALRKQATKGKITVHPAIQAALNSDFDQKLDKKASLTRGNLLGSSQECGQD